VRVDTTNGGFESGPVTKAKTKGELLAVPDCPAMGVIFAVHFQPEAQPVAANSYETKQC